MSIPTVLLIHPPKTGGTTANIVLREALGDRLRYHGHRMWRERRRRAQVGDGLIVGTCRHPAARFVSAYCDLFARKLKRGEADRYGHKVLKRWKTPWAFLLEAPDEEILGVLKFQPQVRWLAPRGKLVVDRLLRCEHLNEDLTRLLKRWELPVPEIPRVNTTDHPHWEHLLTGAMLERLGRMYADDFRVLPYGP